jgi:hypothetical protein
LDSDLDRFVFILIPSDVEFSQLESYPFDRWSH